MPKTIIERNDYQKFNRRNLMNFCQASKQHQSMAFVTFEKKKLIRMKPLPSIASHCCTLKVIQDPFFLRKKEHKYAL